MENYLIDKWLKKKKIQIKSIKFPKWFKLKLKSLKAVKFPNGHWKLFDLKITDKNPNKKHEVPWSEVKWKSLFIFMTMKIMNQIKWDQNWQWIRQHQKRPVAVVDEEKKTHHKLDMRYKKGRAVLWKKNKNKTKLPSNVCVWHINPLIHNGRAFKLPSRRHNHWENGWLKTAYATESQQHTPQQSLTDRQDPRRVTTVAKSFECRFEMTFKSEK